LRHWAWPHDHRPLGRLEALQIATLTATLQQVAQTARWVVCVLRGAHATTGLQTPDDPQCPAADLRD
jgi:hypothetical protein